MIDLSADKSGVRIPIRVQPKASADRIIGEHAGCLKVAVCAPPEDGKANDAVVKLLSKKLDVSKSSIKILSGHTSRQKILHVDGLTIGDVVSRLMGKAEGRDGNDECGMRNEEKAEGKEGYRP